MECTMEPFSQFEKRTESNILWLAEIFTRDYLEVAQPDLYYFETIKMTSQT